MQVENQAKSTTRIGRFAPSPTGSLHFGSLIAAVTSYLCARNHPDSKWLLRIEDVDTQRTKKDAAQSIIKTLEAYGFQWDGEITYQSERNEFYQEALERLSKHTYPCSCTRKKLRTLSRPVNFCYRYPGLCRESPQNPFSEAFAIRLTTNQNEICFNDDCQPENFCQNIENEIGDFILKRRDGLFAYQLAVVVDDHLQGVNHVVRGFDLFDNTPRQIYLQQLLEYNTPNYLHFPLATDKEYKKFSKQNLSPEINIDKKRELLIQTLDFLGQRPPSVVEFSGINDLWSWAFEHWNEDSIPKVQSIICDSSEHYQHDYDERKHHE